MPRWLSPLLLALITLAMVLGLFPVPAVSGPDRLELQLPDRTVMIRIAYQRASPQISLELLAQALGFSIKNDSGETVALVWPGGRLLFRANQRKVSVPGGTATLTAPARRRGSALWVPPDAAAVAARARFGAERVQWDAGGHRVMVGSTSAQISGLRVGVHEDKMRVVLEAAHEVAWAVRPEGEGRLVVTFPGSTLSRSITRQEFHGELLRSIEPSRGPDGAEIRLAFKGGTDQGRWFALHNPFRIVVDLHRAAPRPTAAAPVPVVAAETEHGPVGPALPWLAPPVRFAVVRPAALSRPEPLPDSGGVVAPPAARQDRSETDAAPPPAAPPSLAERVPSEPPVSAGPPLPAGKAPLPAPPRAGPRLGHAPGEPLIIVIDPGHGGKDTGAIGPRGLKEKDIVLDIGLRVRRLLVDRLGARAIMTRSDDTFVALEERTGIAKRAQADFFISIHVNAAHQARATGVETYYLSREPSDGDARASATRENLVMNLEGIGPREQEGLKAILWDMAQTLHIQESSALAEILLEDLGRSLRVETRGVKHGPFVVLMTAGMPSTLVEVGFLSNPQVERRLQEESYRQHIAVALSQGVEKFAHRYQRRIGMRAPRPGPS